MHRNKRFPRNQTKAIIATECFDSYLSRRDKKLYELKEAFPLFFSSETQWLQTVIVCESNAYSRLTL